MDRGKEYLARFADYLKNFGVEQEVMPLEAPWKNGRVEKAGGLVPRDEERVTTMCASLPILLPKLSKVASLETEFRWLSSLAGEMFPTC